MTSIFPKSHITPFSFVGRGVLEIELLLISSCFNRDPHKPHYPANDVLRLHRWIPIASIHNCEGQADSPHPDSLPWIRSCFITLFLLIFSMIYTLLVLHELYSVLWFLQPGITRKLPTSPNFYAFHQNGGPHPTVKSCSGLQKVRSRKPFG